MKRNLKKLWDIVANIFHKSPELDTPKSKVYSRLQRPGRAGNGPGGEKPQSNVTSKT